jgi:hypothetical protein
MSLGGDPDDASWRAAGDAYWSLADVGEELGYSVRLRECIEDWFGRPPIRHPVTIEDLRWATHIVLYSFGGASAWHLWHNAQPPIEGIPYELLVMVATVPDAALMQFGIGLWHAPKYVRRVVNYDVQDIPTSCTLKDCPHAIFGDTTERTLWGHGITYRCDNLFPAVLPIGQKHIQIKDHPQVLAAIAALLRNSAQSGESGLLSAGDGTPLPTSGGAG